MKIFYLVAVLTVLIFSNPAFSQEIFTVKGTIENSVNAEPVANANIFIRGTNTGTSSDLDGSFELNLERGTYTLVVSAVGYKSYKATLNVPQETSIPLIIRFVPDEMEIDDVDIFGSYFLSERDTSIKSVPVSLLPAITTVSAVEIEKQGAVTLIDAMKFVPGGWTETRGRKTKQFFSVRGQKYPYPDYSINGVWQKEFEETGYYLSALDIESVEIVRSSSALVKGLSGLTGVIDIKTKRPDRETLIFNSKYGSLNNYFGNLQYGNKVKDVSFTTSASFFGTNGPKGMNGKERIGNLHGNLDWDINQRTHLTTGLTYIQGLRQLMRIDDEIGAPNIKNRIEQYDPVRTLLSYVKLNYKGRNGARTEFQSNLSYRDVDYFTYNVQQDASANHKENDWEYGVNILHSRPLSETNTLRIGGLYNHWIAPDGKRFYVGRSSNVHTYSGVIANEQSIGRVSLDAGFRLIGGYIVEWGGFGIEGSAAGFNNVEPIVNQAAPVEWQTALGVSMKLSSITSLHYNASGGTIAPRKGSLTNNGDAPDSEGRLQHDLGFRIKTPGKNELSVSTFYTKRNKAIGYSGQTIVTDNDLVMELYENIDKRTYGIELSAKVNLPVIYSSIFANGLLMKAEKEIDGKMVKDVQMPEMIFNSGIYFNYSGFDFNLFVNYTGAYSNNRFVVPSWVQQHGDFPLGDFVAMDMSAGYTFKGNYDKRFFIEVKNMLDDPLMTVAGYPDPGRIFMAGIRLSN